MRKIFIKRSGIGADWEEVDEHTSVRFHLDNGKEYTAKLRDDGLSITETTGLEIVVLPASSNKVTIN